MTMPADTSSAPLPRETGQALVQRPLWAADTLRGQAALVTGANSGIGKAVALALSRAGADVVVNYVSNPEAADAVVQEIRRSGCRAIAIRADVSKEDEVLALFDQAIQAFSTLHIVVCNAGLQRDAPFH